jgi:hypothetical protein
MIVSAHQPDLLPYSGFFHKVARSDVFDLKIWDQYVQRGYQRRVKMRDKWVGVPVITDSSTAPIDTLRIDPDVAPAVLVEGIRRSYRNAKHWDKYGPMICDEILSTRTELLWQFNFSLIVMIRDILGIRTPISVGCRHEKSRSAGVIESLQIFGTPTYLSGPGARAYMGDCAEFIEAGIPVIFHNHAAVTGDSILTVLMDYDDPLAVVMAEHDDTKGNP